MSSPNRPTLVYPNGGEDILSRVIEISWIEPNPVSLDNTAVWYEIFYTEDFSESAEPDWKQIGSVPQGTRSFQWKVGSAIHSDRVRVGILSVNVRGERSDYSISAASFKVRKLQPVAPSVLSPVPGGIYGSSLDIVMDDSAIRGTSAQRAKYYVFFSSKKAQIPLSPIAQKVPVGTGPLVWDTSLVKPSDDYVVTVYLADDDGNKSSEVNISGLTIRNEGVFLIDTKAPSGFVLINRGDEFTRDPNVSVQLYSFDETTDAHSMRFKEGDTFGGAESYVNLKYYKFAAGTDDAVEDGIKTLKAMFQDFGGNRTSLTQRVFRPFFEIENTDVGDMILQKSNNTVWVALNGDSPAIYKIEQGSSFVCRVNEKVNALAILNETLYVSVHTTDGTAVIYRLTGNELSEVIGLSEVGSEGICMAEYKGKLYFGATNGKLYAYDESSVDAVKTLDSSISRLYSDGSLLYIILKNSSSVIVYDGTQSGEVSA